MIDGVVDGALEGLTGTRVACRIDGPSMWNSWATGVRWAWFGRQYPRGVALLE